MKNRIPYTTAGKPRAGIEALTGNLYADLLLDKLSQARQRLADLQADLTRHRAALRDLVEAIRGEGCAELVSGEIEAAEMLLLEE